MQKINPINITSFTTKHIFSVCNTTERGVSDWAIFLEYQQFASWYLRPRRMCLLAGSWGREHSVMLRHQVFSLPAITEHNTRLTAVQGCTTRADPFQDSAPTSALNYLISPVISLSEICTGASYSRRLQVCPRDFTVLKYSVVY